METLSGLTLNESTQDDVLDAMGYSSIRTNPANDDPRTMIVYKDDAGEGTYTFFFPGDPADPFKLMPLKGASFYASDLEWTRAMKPGMHIQDVVAAHGLSSAYWRQGLGSDGSKSDVRYYYYGVDGTGGAREATAPCAYFDFSYRNGGYYTILHLFLPAGNEYLEMRYVYHEGDGIYGVYLTLEEDPFALPENAQAIMPIDPVDPLTL